MILTKVAPGFAIVSIDIDNSAEEVKGLVKGLATLE